MTDDNPCSCSRRSFLRGSGLTLAGFGLSSLFPTAFIRHAMAATVGDERLLFIFLRGGNDGINSVIPHGDPDYNATTRGTIYIPPGSAINLNGFASFHPALSPMMDAFNAGELAVIHRVGYPNQSQSHFHGQRVWENGKPNEPTLFQGWLARFIFEHALQFPGELPALTVQPQAPIIMRGTAGVYANISDPGGFYDIAGPKQTKLISAWRNVFSQFQDTSGLQPYRPLLAASGIRLMDTLAEYESWDQANWHPKDPDNPTQFLFPVSQATNPVDPGGPNGRKFSAESYAFFTNLKVAALALLETTGTVDLTRVAGTEMQGFDLHVRAGTTGGRQAELLSWLAYGMRSLRIVLSGAAIDTRTYPAIWTKTTVITLSEFGRTSYINCCNGTDHAKASCVWVAGGNVNGGVYNCDSSTWPTGAMFEVDGRYLSHRTDYRSVFWEILRDHMGAASATVDQVFPGYTGEGLGSGELGLINTA